MPLIKALIISATFLLSACLSTPERITITENLPNIYDRRPGQTALSDEAIEVQAREDLNNDQEIASQSHININAYNGTVLVSGETPDPGLHDKIIHKIRLVKEVKRVLDEIEIAPPTHPASHYNDSTITNRIKTELDKIVIPVGFKSDNIKIFTENGHVYLMGLVYKEEADVVTKTAQGVQGISKISMMFEYLR